MTSVLFTRTIPFRTAARRMRIKANDTHCSASSLVTFALKRTPGYPEASQNWTELGKNLGPWFPDLECLTVTGNISRNSSFALDMRIIKNIDRESIMIPATILQWERYFWMAYSACCGLSPLLRSVCQYWKEVAESYEWVLELISLPSSRSHPLDRHR